MNIFAVLPLLRDLSLSEIFLRKQFAHREYKHLSTVTTDIFNSIVSSIFSTNVLGHSFFFPLLFSAL